MKRRGRVYWDSLVIFGGEWLLLYWKRFSWFKLREQRKVEEDQKIILEVVPKDMSIKELTDSMTSDRIEWWKRIQVADLD